MTATDVLEFVLTSCPGRATGSAKLVVTATRSVLDWLYLTGMVEVSLSAAVPAVAGWKLAGLPQALTSAQLRALLGSRDRRTPTGRRDYAIVLLLARLGLRSLAEVGQVLRHRTAFTTAIYAKADRDALVVLARPWPTGQNGGVS